MVSKSKGNEIQFEIVAALMNCKLSRRSNAVNYIKIHKYNVVVSEIQTVLST